MAKHKIGIIGAGFVGSACEIGFDSIADIKIYDKYKDTESLDTVVNHAEIIFVCVPTPTDFDTGKCDTSIVENVCEEICKLADTKKCIVIKSTVPPKTTENLQSKFEDHILVFNPEFLTERNFIDDFKYQDRIIVGSSKKETKLYKKLISFYEYFRKCQDVYKVDKDHTKIIECSSNEAEMLKYVSNTFLASKVAFFNEIYEICKASDISYSNTISMLFFDHRIGIGHTQVPGSDGQFGFSGKCFPKDLNALMYFAKEHNVDPLILETIWSKNLMIRNEHDWLNIPGASTDNMDFNKK